jgi:stage II sporulation protein AA (anti-sigma F factor antagonist)
MLLTVDRHEGQGITVLRLRGELDHFTGERLQAIVRECLGLRRRRFILNLRDVTYMTPTGVAILGNIYVQIVREGGQMKLCSLTPFVETLMRHTAFLSYFERYEDEEAASNSFARAA